MRDKQVEIIFFAETKVLKIYESTGDVFFKLLPPDFETTLKNKNVKIRKSGFKY